MAVKQWVGYNSATLNNTQIAEREIMVETNTGSLRIGDGSTLGGGNRIDSRAVADARYQALDGTLTALAGVTFANGKMLYATGADAFALVDSVASGRNLLGVNLSAAGSIPFGTGTGDAIDKFTSSSFMRGLMNTADVGALVQALNIPGMTLVGTPVVVSAEEPDYDFPATATHVLVDGVGGGSAGTGVAALTSVAGRIGPPGNSATWARALHALTPSSVLSITPGAAGAGSTGTGAAGTATLVDIDGDTLTIPGAVAAGASPGGGVVINYNAPVTATSALATVDGTWTLIESVPGGLAPVAYVNTADGSRIFGIVPRGADSPMGRGAAEQQAFIATSGSPSSVSTVTNADSDGFGAGGGGRAACRGSSNTAASAGGNGSPGAVKLWFLRLLDA